MTTPVTHLEQGYQKEMDLPIQLFTLTLKKSGTIVRLRNGPTITWQGQEYSEWPSSLSEVEQNTDGEASRPILTLANPDGVFTPQAENGEFDLATLVVKEVLQDHLLANLNIFSQRTWFISKPVSVNRMTISLQCHSATDVPNFDVPPRMYLPPDFPFLVY